MTAYLFKFLNVFLIIIPFILTLSGCYPMPKEGEYSTVPTTNNPDVVGRHNCGMLPGSGF